MFPVVLLLISTTDLDGFLSRHFPRQANADKTPASQIPLDVFGENERSPEKRNTFAQGDVESIIPAKLAQSEVPGYISYNKNPYLYFLSVSKRTLSLDTNADHEDPQEFNTNKENSDGMKRNNFSQLTPEMKPTRERNKKAYVAEEDEKLRVPAYKMKQYPYNNIVQLSSGCTGTLLTPLHVLTAAHCVHDGRGFLENIGMLKVQVPGKIGYRVHYIVKINVPISWSKSQHFSEIARAAYDYAILQLNIPVSGRKKFMPLSIPSSQNWNRKLFFFGFLDGQIVGQGLWKSECGANQKLVLMNRNMLLTECDSAAGNSGASVFTESSRGGEKIIGLLSNTVSAIPPTSASPETSRYSTITLFTLPKCLDICAMIHPYGDRFGVCSAVKKYSYEKFLLATNRILPFFG